MVSLRWKGKSLLKSRQRKAKRTGDTDAADDASDVFGVAPLICLQASMPMPTSAIFLLHKSQRSNDKLFARLRFETNIARLKKDA